VQKLALSSSYESNFINTRLRTRIRKALSSSLQVTQKPDATPVDAKVRDDGQFVDKMEELTRIIGKEKEREVSIKLSCKGISIMK
jgi:hypothetical protein